MLEDNTTEVKPQETPVQQLPQNAAMQAMMFLQKNSAEVHKLIESIPSHRQLKRVVHALMDHPLNEDSPKFSYPEERDLYNLAAQFQSNKLILLYCSFKEQELAESIKKQADQQTESDTKTEENKNV